MPTLSREYRWGEEIANFSANLYGQITVRDSRKFATKVKNLLGKNEGGKFGLLRDLPSKFLGFFRETSKYYNQPGVHTTLHNFALNAHMYEGTF